MTNPQERRQERPLSDIDFAAGAYILRKGARALGRLAEKEYGKRDLRKLRDYGEVALGLLVLYSAARPLLDHAVSNTKDFVTSDGQIGPLHLSRGARIALLAGGVWTGFEVVQHLEQEREKTSLEEAPKQAATVRQIFEEQQKTTETVEVSGKKTPVTGAQARAVEYSEKIIEEQAAQLGKGSRDIRTTRAAARKLIEMAFSATDPRPELQEALLTMAGDTFEDLLMIKEIKETAAAISRRPQDVLVASGKEIARIGSKLAGALNAVPGLRRFIPDNVPQLLAQVAGEKPLNANGLQLDPHAFINAGSERTQVKVREELERQFQEVIKDEEDRNATAVQVHLLNDNLPAGIRLSEEHRTDFVNTLIAATLIQMMPDRSPQVAQLVGVLDTYQNAPEKLGPLAADRMTTRRRGRR